MANRSPALMAKHSPPRRSARLSTLDKQARSLARDAAKTAGSLTVQILGGAKPPRAPRRAKGAAAPQKFATSTAQADATPQLTAAAPAFGDVLRSIGHAVAVTQTALDDAALESLKTLSAQNVDVPVLVEQFLLDNGEPGTVTITKAPMPLTSIIMPSMQQVEQMTLRMDMRVEKFDLKSGRQIQPEHGERGRKLQWTQFRFCCVDDETPTSTRSSRT